jgi:threonine dehydratase
MTESDRSVPCFADLKEAAARLKGVAVTTPLLESELLNKRLGIRLLVKPESLQKTGSFKFRGAYNTLARHADVFRRRGIVAYSGGNHAQGAAAAAALLGVDAVVLMPSDAPALKIQRTQAYGATVQLHDRWKDDRDALAAEIIQQTGRVLVPSFDHFDVICGQGTVGLEIASQCADAGIEPDAVLFCCGGGGLSAGASLATKTLMPATLAFGAEPEAFDDTRRSLLSGRREDNSRGARSICDALLTRCGELTLSMNRNTLNGVLTVSDSQVLDAMRTLFVEFKLVAEPGGAAAFAASMSHAWPRSRKNDQPTVVAVVSGGNVEPAVYAAALV